MTHPLVVQLRFARSEFVRCLEGVADEEARRRFEPMNCISWLVGHLANQENTYWVMIAQGKQIRPDLYPLVGYGKPASTPPLTEMWAAWREVTAVADPYLDTLTTNTLQTHFEWKDKPMRENVGTITGSTTAKPTPFARCWDTLAYPNLLAICRLRCTSLNRNLFMAIQVA